MEKARTRNYFCRKKLCPVLTKKVFLSWMLSRAKNVKEIKEKNRAIQRTRKNSKTPDGQNRILDKEEIKKQLIASIKTQKNPKQHIKISIRFSTQGM